MDIRATNRLLDYRDFSGFSLIFIETGSGHGDGIQRALDAGFKTVISIEAQREFFDICAKRYANNPNVKLFHGRSEHLLPRVISQCEGERVVIFLDAHPSGIKSFGHNELMSGNVEFSQDFIIRRELLAILNDGRPHVVIIDDVNGLTDGFALQYGEMILEEHPNYEFLFYDENLSGNHLYVDKLLVALPGEQ